MRKKEARAAAAGIPSAAAWRCNRGGFRRSGRRDFQGGQQPQRVALAQVKPAQRDFRLKSFAQENAESRSFSSAVRRRSLASSRAVRAPSPGPISTMWNRTGPAPPPRPPATARGSGRAGNSAELLKRAQPRVSSARRISVRVMVLLSSAGAGRENGPSKLLGHEIEKIGVAVKAAELFRTLSPRGEPGRLGQRQGAGLEAEGRLGLLQPGGVGAQPAPVVTLVQPFCCARVEGGPPGPASQSGRAGAASGRSASEVAGAAGRAAGATAPRL